MMVRTGDICFFVRLIVVYFDAFLMRIRDDTHIYDFVGK